mgnify:CR=1 FL=1
MNIRTLLSAMSVAGCLSALAIEVPVPLVTESGAKKGAVEALDKGEVVVCNRTGKHFEAITEVDLKTGLCKVVSDVADPYGGCVRWRNLKAVALEMIGVSTSFQFFHVK